MIKDFISSFKENITQKTTNPFLGTFLIVWIIRDWKFVYSLFNFDKGYTLERKISTIESYFKDYNSYIQISICIIEAIGILIATYFLLNISRLIVNLFEKTVTPFVYKLTDKSSIVLKTEYIQLREELSRLEVRLEEERQAKLKYKAEIESLEQRLTIPKNNNQTTEDPSTVNASESNLDLLSYDSKVQILKSRLIKNKISEEFNETSGDILNGTPILRDTRLTKEFVKLGLIEPSENVNANESLYKLTNLGREVHESLMLEDPENDEPNKPLKFYKRVGKL